jgi:hypothetical protein
MTLMTNLREMVDSDDDSDDESYDEAFAECF